jgi:hypothetical protein
MSVPIRDALSGSIGNDRSPATPFRTAGRQHASPTAARASALQLSEKSSGVGPVFPAVVLFKGWIVERKGGMSRPHANLIGEKGNKRK